jgi:arylsulfatase A-like enzyme
LFVHTGRDYGSDVTKAIAGEKEAVHSGVPYYAALSHHNMKYIRYLAGNEPEELYDLDNDPEELTNLAGESGSQAILSRLRKQLLDELQLADAKFLEHLPAVAADR